MLIIAILVVDIVVPLRSYLFLFFFTPDILQTIARETNRYGNEDWVMESKQYHTTDNSDSESSDDWEHYDHSA